MKSFTTLDEMIRSPEFDSYRSDGLGNDLFINDSERADRIHKAAENGCDGSTHAEVIEDWRDYLNTLKVYDPDLDEPEDKVRRDLTQEIYDKISKEIDEVEEWHRRNGSLDTQLG